MDEITLKQRIITQETMDTPSASRKSINFVVRLFERFFYLASIWLILVGINTASAQSVVPPPGFAPGQVIDATPEMPPEPKTFSGSGGESEIFDGSSSGGYPNRKRAMRAERYGRFPKPISPVLIEDTEPALPRVWFRSEGLLWWSKSSPMPVPVVTQGSLADAIPGALGQPGTSVLLGNQNIGIPTRGGGRFTFGFSFDPAQTWGVEGTYFSLADVSMSQSVFSDGSSGSPFLGFPFYNPNKPGEDATPLALPGAFAGQTVLSLQTILQGTDVNLLHNISNSGGVRIDLLGGFRYINFQEDLKLTTDSPNIDPNNPGFFHTFDAFNINNNFYGSQFGVRASIDRARYFVNATGKMAIGSTFENVSVNGGTFTNIGGYASAPGAYLSQPTNLGSTTHSQFAVVPEMNLNAGFRLAPWASIIVGYSFLYISSVARPGDQIDRVINPTQSSAITNNFPANLSGVARPGLTVHSTDFWAQGLNFALELRF
jgi:hypothetical protein